MLDLDKKINDHFILGIDQTARINLSDGYVSIWSNSYNNKVMVYSFWDCDQEVFYYDIIPYQDNKDLLYIIDDILEYDSGYKESYSVDLDNITLKDLEDDHLKLNIIFTFQIRQGEVFLNLKKANNLKDLLKKIIVF